MDQKWHVIGSQTLLRDRWIDVRADDCITSVGVKISPYYVLTYPDWVHVVAITSAGALLLVLLIDDRIGCRSLRRQMFVEPFQRGSDHRILIA